MKTLFPTMVYRPESRKIVATFLCWLFSFVAVPFLMPVALYVVPQKSVGYAWIELAFHLINCVFMLCIHWDYLGDAWVELKVRWRQCWIIIPVCAAVIWFLSDLLALVLGSVKLLYALPVTEAQLLLFPAELMYLLPVPGLLCHVLMAPLTVSCMIYAVCFAPGACSRHPWVGYLLLLILAAVPRLASTTFSYVDIRYLLSWYAAQLPAHLICCWAFQKTDNVLVPAGILAIINLVGSTLV